MSADDGRKKFIICSVMSKVQYLYNIVSYYCYYIIICLRQDPYPSLFPISGFITYISSKLVNTSVPA